MDSFEKQIRGLERSFRRTYREEKQGCLEAAIALLRTDDEARILLDLAESQGVKIIMSDALLDAKYNGKFLRSEQSDRQTIKLRPGRTVRETAKTLGHELFHFFQAKDLGVSNERRAALESPDLEAWLLVTRVKEADAATRANALMRRLDKKPDGGAKQMRDDFIEKLQSLGNYDLRRVRTYHKLYTRPGASLKKAFNAKSLRRDEKPVGVTQLRAMLRVSILSESQNYMTGMTNDVFKAMVLSPIRKDIRRAVQQLDKVEKEICAGKMKTLAVRKMRYELHEKVTAL